jgi:regulator of CtrA degradation
MLSNGLRPDAGDGGAVSFGQKLAASDAFRSLFREGMTLVEETAGYLDGKGREDSRGLSRNEALAYASESMRLTTRLMQLASWLLLQRAVNEGEMTQSQAATEKHKVKLSRQELSSNPETFMRLPARMQDLATQSLRLQARIIHLDRLLYTLPATQIAATRPAALESQLEQLRRAFTPLNH